MYKIGEFSSLCQVSTRMLRHYEKLGLLQPDAVDRDTGYRYFTKRQLEQVHRIVALKELGMSLKQMRQLLNQNLTPDELNRILVQKRTELHNEIEQKQRVLQRVGARLAILEQEGDVFTNEIIVKSVPAVTLASRSVVVTHMSHMEVACARAYGELYDEVKRLGLQIAGPETTLYLNDAFTEENIRMEAAVQVQPCAAVVDSGLISVYELPGEVSVAALLYEGGYDGLEKAVLQLLHWIGMQSYCMMGPVRELHLSGAAHPDGQLVKSALIELQAPIRFAQSEAIGEYIHSN